MTQEDDPYHALFSMQPNVHLNLGNGSSKICFEANLQRPLERSRQHAIPTNTQLIA